MAEVTLSQILAARERRAKLQKELIAQYDRPIISFTMNIAGPIKTSPLIERAFNYGLEELRSRLSCDKLIDRRTITEDTGYEAFFSIDADPSEVKKICTSIEDETPIGRLFDMDVIGIDGKKLNRDAERGCIVCGASGRACAAGRLHPVSEISAVCEKMMRDCFFENDKKIISELAVASLLQEVNTTPKPGLVDKNNSGSHRDMDIDSFIRSANALGHYFAECFDIGDATRALPPDEVFPPLRSAGIKAEAVMYSATGGVNTHKGIIYSMGIICAAVGRLWTPERPYAEISEITDTCSHLATRAIEEDLRNIDSSTGGGKCYRSLGITGIRGEVLSGFSSVKSIALPTYTDALQQGYSENDAGVLTLIKLISQVDDTNLYHRGGKEGAEYASGYAKEILNKLPVFSLSDIEEMDREFIKRNLSPGGCADLLSITYFFHAILKL